MLVKTSMLKEWLECATEKWLHDAETEHRHKCTVFRVHTSKNSITPSLAFLTRGVSVLMSMPGPTGIAHEATGFGLLVTCTHRCNFKPGLD